MEALNPLSFLLALILAMVLIGWFFLNRVRSLLLAKGDDRSLMLMQEQVDQLRLQLNQVLDHSTQAIQQQLGQILGHVNDRLRENADALRNTQQTVGERLDSAARLVGSVQKSLGGLEEANRKIYEVGKDIASLQEILRAPKLRGGLGEFFLQELLAQVLPARHFSMQHAFRSGEKVDAVIKLGSLLVPVDAKFPLENFKRTLDVSPEEDRSKARKQFIADVKRHIDAIAAKYILPDEGTYEFALMYIPAENVYYEVIVKDDGAGHPSLSHYALDKRVIPVSPGSLYAYLQAIVLGLKGMKIEESAKHIIQYLGRLQGDFAKFREDFDLLGRHLGHAQSVYQGADRRLEQFGQKLLSADAEPVRRCSPPE